MQAASGSRRSPPRRRARADEMGPSTPKNTATICLDGTEFEVLRSYILAMKDLDEWFRAGTEVIGVSQFFGPGIDIVRTRNGIFNMGFEYQGKSLTVPIEGRNLYIRGFSNEYGHFELDFGSDSKFIHDKRFTVLDIGVNYNGLLKGTLESTKTGMWAMRNAVKNLCNYNGGSAKPFGPSVGALAIHISEPARNRVVHSFICRSIVDEHLSILNDGKGLVTWIRKYSSLSRKLLENVNRMYEGEEPLPIIVSGLTFDLRDVVVALKVCPIDAYSAGVFKIKSTENGSALRRKEMLMPYKIPREKFATSSGMSLKNTVTEGSVFEGGQKDIAQETSGGDIAQETRGGGLMPDKTQSLMSQKKKAETPWTLKFKKIFRLRVDLILPKILSCRRSLRILPVGPPVTTGVIGYNSMKELLNVPPRKGGPAVVDRTRNLFRFFCRRETNRSYCPGDKKKWMLFNIPPWLGSSSMKELLNVPPRKGGPAVVDRTRNLFRFFCRRETNRSYCPGDKKKWMLFNIPPWLGSSSIPQGPLSSKSKTLLDIFRGDKNKKN